VREDFRRVERIIELVLPITYIGPIVSYRKVGPWFGSSSLASAIKRLSERGDVKVLLGLEA
jgi:hypothetical protein